MPNDEEIHSGRRELEFAYTLECAEGTLGGVDAVD